MYACLWIYLIERQFYVATMWQCYNDAFNLIRSNAETLLADKQEQIDELLMEGEKLSKQMHTYSQNMKKLRVKEKHNNTTITDLKFVAIVLFIH